MSDPKNVIRLNMASNIHFLSITHCLMESKVLLKLTALFFFSSFGFAFCSSFSRSSSGISGTSGSSNCSSVSYSILDAPLNPIVGSNGIHPTPGIKASTHECASLFVTL